MLVTSVRSARLRAAEEDVGNGVTYVNLCLECKGKGTPFKYCGETSGSLYEHANVHISEGESCLISSHMCQHILCKHPEGIRDLRSNFRFGVVNQHKTGFCREMEECLLIKNSKWPVMMMPCEQMWKLTEY